MSCRDHGKFVKSEDDSVGCTRPACVLYQSKVSCSHRKSLKDHSEFSLLTYLCPSLPVEHRPSTTPRHRTLFWAALVIPDQLVPCCFSSRLASLPLPLRVPGQGLACGAGYWLPEGVSDPVPLPTQYLLGHWFLSRSLPQIFISDLLGIEIIAIISTDK